MPLALTSASFANGANIPAVYTCEGGDRSPALAWSGPPSGVRSYVLIVDDPDAPSGTFTHWVLFDVPGTATSIPETTGGEKAGGKQGRNDFGKSAYRGPCPPRGHGAHRYYFRLFALNVPTLSLKEGAARAEVERAMKGHIVGQAEWMGRYERK